MSQGNQSRLGKWLVIAFVGGTAAGFIWALLRPHPQSEYRASLANQREAL